MSYEQMMLYNSICEISFTCVDLNLYLDTHPEDCETVTCYNEYCDKLMELKKQYDECYGPLCNFGYSKSKCPWQWNKSPWPWECKGGAK